MYMTIQSVVLIWLQSHAHKIRNEKILNGADTQIVKLCPIRGRLQPQQTPSDPTERKGYKGMGEISSSVCSPRIIKAYLPGVHQDK